MGRIADTMTTPATTTQGRPSAPGAASPPPKPEGHRETVEAIVVAMILALVVRGFEAQAFVIPTGSMAPTLMGRHKEVTCPQCGFVYSVNASEEVDGGPRAQRVYAGTCVNCRYQAIHLDDAPSFKGDRILVSMFPYDLPDLPGSSPPQRYDVVVFRYPEEPETSYIKRLIGLPGETIRIEHGDVYVKPKGADAFRLQRKPLRRQAAMMIPVHDDRYQARATMNREEWRRWTGDEPGAWKAGEAGTSRYACESSSGSWSDLRYRHLVPDPDQWEALLDDRTPRRKPRPTLVTDFYSYNTNLVAGVPLDSPSAWFQPHWVGDLTLEADVDVASAEGELKLELIKGGVPHRILIDLATGKARFVRGEETLGEEATPIVGAGRHHVAFANVDDRLSLTVDGRPIGGDGFEFDAAKGPLVPTAADLSPAAVGVRGAKATVSDLVLKRDIYYTQTPGENDYGPVWSNMYPRTAAELFDFLADDSNFPALARVRNEEFELGDDRFMMMGDNSPRSKDSRGWSNLDEAWDVVDRKSWEVPRSLLTGRAFFVYWPNGTPCGPDVRISRDVRVPFRPYLERMRWIR